MSPFWSVTTNIRSFFGGMYMNSGRLEANSIGTAVNAETRSIDESHQGVTLWIDFGTTVTTSPVVSRMG